MIRQSGRYALRALTHLAGLQEGAYAGAREVARMVDAPGNYLGKILQTLASAGLLVSRKGRGGGYRLARDPRHLYLLEILDPVEDVSRLETCFLGGGRCDEQNACAVHERWGRLQQEYLTLLREVTLAELMGADASKSSGSHAGKPSA